MPARPVTDGDEINVLTVSRRGRQVHLVEHSPTAHGHLPGEKRILVDGNDRTGNEEVLLDLSLGCPPSVGCPVCDVAT